MNDNVENGNGPNATPPPAKPEEAGNGFLAPARHWLLPGSQTLFLGILALIACFAVARTLQPVLMPLAFAWVLSAMLAPMVRKLTDWKVPHGLAVAFAIILTVFLFFRAGILVNELVSSFVAKYGDYSAKLTSLLKFFYAKLPPRAVEVLTAFDWQTRAGKMVMSLSSLLISVSSKVVMILIVTAFILIEQRDFGKKLEAAFPNHIADKISSVLGGITNQVSRYLLLQFVISLATGICVWLALWAIGVEFSLTWGVLAFVLNFIPTIGSIIASIPPVLVALVQWAPDSYWQPVVAALALLAIQMTIGNVISPRVMGDHLNLSPVAVLVFLLFWSWLWGPAGALLSVPITAAIKIVCDNIAPLSPIGVLLGSGRAVREA